MLDETKWILSNSWVASFDILGFKNMVNVDGATFEATLIMEDYEETLAHLESTCRDYQAGFLDYSWLSDTFIIFSRDDSAQSYALIQQASKHFFEKCLYSSIPLRGALSEGSFIRSKDGRSLMGKAFIEAFTYGEDQDWLGFLLTPSAILKARSFGLEPSRHDFVSTEEIPMRKCLASDVMACRLQNGRANFSSPFIHFLQQMRHQAGPAHFNKYDRTIQFIQNHYRFIEPSIG
ncbi:hypothetical protein [Geothrix alkalitolerans]|uniref:hypothetical protein n=1 Tax=Geothrix alkalitolerans TaxID=2922724 RepID=UPI001FAF5165|nr:hypothetical protein [Geothrix alkalitolerans]